MSPLRSPLTRLALLAAAALAMLAAPAVRAQNVVIIANPSVPKADVAALQRIYTGKQIDVAGVPVVPVNAPGGNPVRAQFLQTVLNQDDEKYRAYWTVRRFIGKGAPPRELASAQDIIAFVQSTPGAIGYVDQADLKPGTNVTIIK